MTDTKQTDISRALEIVKETAVGSHVSLGCNPAECDLLLKLAVRTAALERKNKELEKIV